MAVYLILVGFAGIAVLGWNAPTAEARHGARMAAIVATVIALQLWWQL